MCAAPGVKEIPSTDPVAIDFRQAVQGGDVDRVRRLLDGDPGLARARFVAADGSGRTSLHVVTDWPGYFAGGPAIARLLIEAGADVDARTAGPGGNTDEPGAETPLHYAASSDDVDVAEVLIDAGADIEAANGSIGTPLDNAIGYGCWQVARLLVARGARVDKLWHAAALGLLERVEQLLARDPAPTPEEISQAFWHACAGAQRRAAERLLESGADLGWEPDYARGTPLDAARGQSTRRENVISWLTRLGAPSTMPNA